MEQLRSNSKIDMAREFIANTRVNIFLTGKAGTGKTTFLKNIIATLGKRVVVAAPTGVAALNAGGVTMHSLFQLAFGVNIPGRVVVSKRFAKNRLALIRSMELLVIDEVSMVRCDVLDAVDATLRQVRRSVLPFGGVQLLLIGDVQQLSPICRDEEWELLREHYQTPYFFDSVALRRTPYITIEFDEIFRQRDPHFTSLLNAVRENRITPDVLASLNERHIPEFEPDDDEDWITLTTHNATANAINIRKLAALKGRKQRFEAKISGDFAEAAYPNDQTLELKVGAQVLFIKNDPSPLKRYYNGMIGTVTKMEESSVTVQPKSFGEEITVEAMSWENLDYTINEQGDVEQSVKGSFSQVPLKCAWAITIHKSQGLSFDRAIIDASGAFAHGQVYVALSRCRTLAGTVLRSPISGRAIVEDATVDGFCRYVTENQPTEEQLEEAKRDNYIKLLCEIFDFSQIQRTLWDLMSAFSGAAARKYPKVISALMDFIGIFERDILKVGVSFQRQLHVAVLDDPNYKDSAFIEERMRQAEGYFTPKLEPLTSIINSFVGVDPASKETKRRLDELLVQLRSELLMVKLALRLSKDSFSMEKFQSERARIIACKEIDKRAVASTKTKKVAAEKVVKRSSATKFPHPELRDTLIAWRKEEADEIEKPLYVVLYNRTLDAVAEHLPTTFEELMEIDGIGEGKRDKYGDQIIEIVKEYCFTHDIEPQKPYNGLK